MHFHLPKPLHGWRAFFGEVGIIVIGVLIALGAEQVVGDLNQLRLANEAESDIRAELARDSAFAAERLAIGDCLRASYNDLGHRLILDGDRWSGMKQPSIDPARMPKMIRLYAFPPPFTPAPKRTWRTSAWTTANSTGALNAAGRERVTALGDLYVLMGMLERANDQESDEQGRMMPLGFSQRLDSPNRLAFLTLLGELDHENALIERVSAELVTAARAEGIAPDPQLLSDLIRRHAWLGTCVKKGPALDAFASEEG